MSLILLSLLLYSDPTIHFSDLVVQYQHLDGFNDIARIQTVVQPEAGQDCILGNIDRVVLDKRLGRIYVADIQSSNAVKCFDMNGKYLGQVSRMGNGPSEYAHQLRGVGVLEDSSVVIASNLSLLKFDKDWKFVSRAYLQKDFDAFIGDALIFPNRIITNNIRVGKSQNAMLFFDKNLKLKKRVHTFDVRLMKYIYNANRTMTEHDGLIWVKSYYDMEIFSYSLDGALKYHYSFPQSNKDALKDLFSKEKVTNADQKQIYEHLHSFKRLHSFGDRLLMYDYRRIPSKAYRMMSLKGKALTIYQGYHFFSRNHEDRDIVFYEIPNSFDGVIIGTMEHDDYFDIVKAKYPELSQIELTSSDNPLLIFAEPRDQ